MAQRQVAMETAMAKQNFSCRQRDSYGIYITGMAKRERQNGNEMVETRH